MTVKDNKVVAKFRGNREKIETIDYLQFLIIAPGLKLQQLNYNYY
jgi:hypothetical protein